MRANNLILIVFCVYCNQIVLPSVVQDHQYDKISVSNDLPFHNAELLIPKIFHTIWLDFGNGNDVFPCYKENMKQLQLLHPGWQYKQWSANEVTDLISKHYPHFYEIFTSYDAPIKKHDSARAAILHRYGGVYLDHDFLPLRNIEPLLRSHLFVVGNGNDRTNFDPTNSIMASVKDFELWNCYINEMNSKNKAEENIVHATGPSMLKNVICKYVNKHSSRGIKVYGSEYFSPMIWDNRYYDIDLTIEQLREKYPSCYLYHQYDFSWKAQ